jgi:uncharacterized protein YggU (UPF0235/DUF167 family)
VLCGFYVRIKMMKMLQKDEKLTIERGLTTPLTLELELSKSPCGGKANEEVNHYFKTLTTKI